MYTFNLAFWKGRLSETRTIIGLRTPQKVALWLEKSHYSTHSLIRTRKGLSFLFELANVRIIGYSENTKNFDVPSHIL